MYFRAYRISDYWFNMLFEYSEWFFFILATVNMVYLLWGFFSELPRRNAKILGKSQPIFGSICRRFEYQPQWWSVRGIKLTSVLTRKKWEKNIHEIVKKENCVKKILVEKFVKSNKSTNFWINTSEVWASQPQWWSVRGIKLTSVFTKKLSQHQQNICAVIFPIHFLRHKAKSDAFSFLK